MCLQKAHYDWKSHQLHKIGQLTQELTDIVDDVDEYAKRMGDGLYIMTMDNIKRWNDIIKRYPFTVEQCWSSYTMAKKNTALRCMAYGHMYQIDCAFEQAYDFTDEVSFICAYFRLLPDAPPYYKGGFDIMPPKDQQKSYFIRLIKDRGMDAFCAWDWRNL